MKKNIIQLLPLTQSMPFALKWNRRVCQKKKLRIIWGVKKLQKLF